MLISSIQGSQRSNSAEFCAADASRYSATSHSATPMRAEHGGAVFADHGCSVHVYQSLSRCQSLTQNITHAQAERHDAVIDFRPHARLIAAVGRDQRLVQNRQAAHFGELLDRGVDGAQRFLLAAVVVAQDVARAHGVVLQVVALGQFRDPRIRQQLAHPLDVEVELERQRHAFGQPAPHCIADRQVHVRVQMIDAVLELQDRRNGLRSAPRVRRLAAAAPTAPRRRAIEAQTEPARSGGGRRRALSVELIARRSLFGQGSIIEAVGTRLSRKNLPAAFIRLAEVRPAFPIVCRQHCWRRGCSRRNAAMRSRFSLRVTVQVAYTRRPPGDKHAPRGLQQTALKLQAICRYPTGTYADGYRDAGGSRPSAEQGASSRMRSKGTPSHHACRRRRRRR